MSLCNQCGNIVAETGCGPTCLVCQKTGRDSGKVENLLLKAEAAALDAAFRAMRGRSAELEAFATVLDAQDGLSQRMQFNDHSRIDERPAWAKAQPQ